MPEFARVLRPGGLLVLKVPYKLYGAPAPYHVRMFYPNTFDFFCDNTRMKTCIPFVRHPFVGGSLEWDSQPLFSMISKKYIHFFPFSWHLAQRFGKASTTGP